MPEYPAYISCTGAYSKTSSCNTKSCPSNHSAFDNKYSYNYKYEHNTYILLIKIEDYLTLKLSFQKLLKNRIHKRKTRINVQLKPPLVPQLKLLPERPSKVSCDFQTKNGKCMIWVQPLLPQKPRVGLENHMPIVLYYLQNQITCTLI